MVKGEFLAKERIFRIEELKNMIKKDDDQRRVIAKFCIKHGTSRRTVLEYLKLLVEAGIVKRDGNTIWVK